MKTKIRTNNQDRINELEFCNLFAVESIEDGKKQCNNFGYFAQIGENQYAIYKPTTLVCDVDDFFNVVNAFEEPSAIQIVTREEIVKMLDEIGELRGIAAHEVNRFTSCGWYYDTIVAQ